MPPRPRSLDTMIRIAERLAEGFTFVRVDMYDIDGHVYVGELTFTPTAGFHLFDPPETDLMLGRLWHKPPPVGPDARDRRGAPQAAVPLLTRDRARM
jgi:hypothetical protein